MEHMPFDLVALGTSRAPSVCRLQLEVTGVALQGVVHQGGELQGRALQGGALQAVAFQGAALQEVARQGAALQGVVLQGVVHQGGALLQGVSNQWVLAAEDLCPLTDQV